MTKKICPDCREPFVAAHPFAVCEPCAERDADAIEEQRFEFLMNAAEREADRAAYHLSFNEVAA